MDDFKSFDDSVRENPDAFIYNTEVEVKNKADGVITRGNFTYGTFGPRTFEIEDSDKIKKTFNKSDILIKIIKVNTERNFHLRGGKKSTRRKSTRRQSTRRKSTRRKSTRRR